MSFILIIITFFCGEYLLLMALHTIVRERTLAEVGKLVNCLYSDLVPY